MSQAVWALLLLVPVGALAVLALWARRGVRRTIPPFERVSGHQSVERRMDTVMATLGEAVIVHDPAGELVYANDAAARLLGFDSAEQAVATPAEQIPERFDIYDEQGLPMPVEALGSHQVGAGE